MILLGADVVQSAQFDAPSGEVRKLVVRPVPLFLELVQDQVSECFGEERFLTLHLGVFDDVRGEDGSVVPGFLTDSCRHLIGYVSRPRYRG